MWARLGLHDGEFALVARSDSVISSSHRKDRTHHASDRLVVLDSILILGPLPPSASKTQNPRVSGTTRPSRSGQRDAVRDGVVRRFAGGRDIGRCDTGRSGIRLGRGNWSPRRTARAGGRTTRRRTAGFGTRVDIATRRAVWAGITTSPVIAGQKFRRIDNGEQSVRRFGDHIVRCGFARWPVHDGVRRVDVTVAARTTWSAIVLCRCELFAGHERFVVEWCRSKRFSRAVVFADE